MEMLLNVNAGFGDILQVLGGCNGHGDPPADHSANPNWATRRPPATQSTNATATESLLTGDDDSLDARNSPVPAYSDCSSDESVSGPGPNDSLTEINWLQSGAMPLLPLERLNHAASRGSSTSSSKGKRRPKKTNQAPKPRKAKPSNSDDKKKKKPNHRARKIDYGLRERAKDLEVDVPENPTAEDYATNPYCRPEFTIVSLIIRAMFAHGYEPISLTEIYDTLKKTYAYYGKDIAATLPSARKEGGSKWENTVRHALTTGKFFEKVPRPEESKGRGSLWKVILEQLTTEQLAACQLEESPPALCLPITKPGSGESTGSGSEDDATEKRQVPSSHEAGQEQADPNAVKAACNDDKKQAANQPSPQPTKPRRKRKTKSEDGREPSAKRPRRLRKEKGGKLQPVTDLADDDALPLMNIDLCASRNTEMLLRDLCNDLPSVCSSPTFNGSVSISEPFANSLPISSAPMLQFPPVHTLLSNGGDLLPTPAAEQLAPALPWTPGPSANSTTTIASSDPHLEAMMSDNLCAQAASLGAFDPNSSFHEHNMRLVHKQSGTSSTGASPVVSRSHNIAGGSSTLSSLIPFMSQHGSTADNPSLLSRFNTPSPLSCVSFNVAEAASTPLGSNSPSASNPASPTPSQDVPPPLNMPFISPIPVEQRPINDLLRHLRPTPQLVPEQPFITFNNCFTPLSHNSRHLSMPADTGPMPAYQRQLTAGFQ